MECDSGWCVLVLSLKELGIPTLMGVLLGFVVNSLIQHRADTRADARQEKANAAAREIALAATREAARLEDLKNRVDAAKLVLQAINRISTLVKQLVALRVELGTKQ